MKNDSQTIVSIELSKIADDLLRVDVLLKNAPRDLFGAAFHLEISGAEWSLQKYEAGNVFAAENFRPLMLASESGKGSGGLSGSSGPHEIIFGLSLKRGDEVAAKDGRLASFYLKTDAEGELKFQFSDAFLSLMEERRQDLGGVVWEEKVVRLENISAGDALQANVLDAPQDFFEVQPLLQVYGVMAMALVFLIMAGSAVLVYRFLKRNKR